MPDTGASQSIVSAATARDANLVILPTVTELRNASGGLMRLLGEASVVMCNDKHSAHSTAVSYTHLRAHETPEHLVCRLLLEKKK